MYHRQMSLQMFVKINIFKSIIQNVKGIKNFYIKMYKMKIYDYDWATKIIIIRKLKI